MPVPLLLAAIVTASSFGRSIGLSVASSATTAILGPSSSGVSRGLGAKRPEAASRSPTLQTMRPADALSGGLVQDVVGRDVAEGAVLALARERQEQPAGQCELARPTRSLPGLVPLENLEHRLEGSLGRTAEAAQGGVVALSRLLVSDVTTAPPIRPSARGLPSQSTGATCRHAPSSSDLLRKSDKLLILRRPSASHGDFCKRSVE